MECPLVRASGYAALVAQLVVAAVTRVLNSEACRVIEELGPFPWSMLRNLEVRIYSDIESSLQHGTDRVTCKVILTWGKLAVNHSSSLACE